MQNRTRVNLGTIVLSLSNAMDLADSSLIRHQQRVAYTTWKMSEVAGFSAQQIEKLFFAALIHDIGAFSLKEKKALMNHEVVNVETHCIRGERVLGNIPWFSRLSDIIRFHHREWQSWEEPIETPLVIESQLIHLADYVERMIDRDKYILHQHEEIKAKIRSLSGTVFHPQAVDGFIRTSEKEEFWLDIVSPRLQYFLLKEGPFGDKKISSSDLYQMSELFRNVIDFRSQFTSTHSSGVATTASILAKKLGFTRAKIELIEVAGNLHDIGKLAIPNRILNKRGKLTGKEMAIMKAHTYHTYSVIKTIDGLDDVAEWAAYHHEKLDGSGYPFRRTAAELSVGARIMMVADIFTALIEDRPYRKGMSAPSIHKMITQFSNRGLLDSDIVGQLFENYDKTSLLVLKEQAAAKKFYNEQFTISADGPD